MMGQGGKGKGFVPLAPPPYQAGPLPMPSALPPQSVAPQQTSSGITDDWAFRRAAGTLAPEAEVITGLMSSVFRNPAMGKGAA